MRLRHKTRKPEEGHAVLEFALTLPVLIILIFGGLEFARMLDRLQWATALSREAANVVSRRCAYQKDLKDLEACINSRMTELTSKSSVLAPGTSFVVAVYSYDATRPSPLMEEYKTADSPYLSIFSSATGMGFNTTLLQEQINSSANGSAGMAILEHGRLTAAAAFIAYHPIAGHILSWALPQQIHSSTLM